MKRISLLFLLLSIFGCTNTEYRFERLDGAQPIVLPLKFDGLYGLRDGASVKAEARFSDGADLVTMDMTLRLGPPAEFISGTYQATIGGKASSGIVECPTLNYLGGQNNQPSVGGLFRLKDQSNQPAYQVRMPPTQMTRRPGP